MVSRNVMIIAGTLSIVMIAHVSQYPVVFVGRDAMGIVWYAFQFLDIVAFVAIMLSVVIVSITAVQYIARLI